MDAIEWHTMGLPTEEFPFEVYNQMENLFGDRRNVDVAGLLYDSLNDDTVPLGDGAENVHVEQSLEHWNLIHHHHKELLSRGLLAMLLLMPNPEESSKRDENEPICSNPQEEWFCVDYKPLNAATKRDHFPLPFQDEILNEVARHERYIVCDGYSGYYQIRIAEEDQHKTTFITPWGCFAFRVMPFGLTNAPSTFTRFTSFIFQPFFGKSIRVFLDDFCTYSNRALHCQRVEEGLQRLYQYGGQLNPDKCHVAEKEVVLLGHVISQEGIKVDPSRVQAILDLPPPNSAQQVITFVQKLQEYEYTFIVEDSTRASLADVLTYKVKEKKITPKATVKLDLSPQGELEDACTLLFDGAYRRQRNKAAGGFVILNEEKKEVLKKGIQLHLAHSNNEAEYATLKAGLEECKSMVIRRLMVKGDALLIVRQVQGTWACKNSKLLQWLHEVKLLMKDFEAIQIQHISRQHNKEADNMANTQFEVMVGAIKFKEPFFQGQETMEDILYFLETGECPKHLERVQRHRLVRKALSYQLIGEHLYHKGKDLVLRRVPLVKEIEKILMSCHDGVCGGHFAQEITSRKVPTSRWAEAASVARITATDVSKFVLDYICSRFGTPLEILSDRGPADFEDDFCEDDLAPTRFASLASLNERLVNDEKDDDNDEEESLASLNERLVNYEEDDDDEEEVEEEDIQA
ncbi:hypothetical protein L7F22_044681 [Adiantum nelumboides]|nr:hypothetical protein [Adiantum nelumboides]